MSRITYTAQSPFGSKVAALVGHLRVAQADIQRCLDEANAITGGGVTPGNLELVPASQTQTDAALQFGVASGQGANFYTALQSIKSVLVPAGVPVQATIDLDQG